MEHSNPFFHDGQPENSSSASKPLRGKGLLHEKQKKQQVVQKAVEGRREENRKLPISCVQRLMRKVLPNYVKVSDESKEMVLNCVVEFINFITMAANQRCQEDLRKTITAEDLINAMSTVGFETNAELLTLYLNRYRQQNQEAGAGNRVPHRAGTIPILPRVANDAVHVPPPMFPVNNVMPPPPPMVVPNQISMSVQRPYLPQDQTHPFPFENPMGTMGGGFYGDWPNGGGGDDASAANDVYNGGGGGDASAANDVYYGGGDTSTANDVYYGDDASAANDVYNGGGGADASAANSVYYGGGGADASAANSVYYGGGGADASAANDVYYGGDISAANGVYNGGGGDASAANDVYYGGGNASATNDVYYGGGNASAANDVYYGGDASAVNGVYNGGGADASAANDVYYGGGNASAANDVYYGGGNASAANDVYYGGDASASNDVYYDPDGSYNPAAGYDPAAGYINNHNRFGY